MAFLKHGDEIFEFMIGRWNVTRAKEIVEGRKPEARIDPRKFKQLGVLMRINKDHAKTVDADIPILMIPIVDEDTDEVSYALPIDGWHRIHRANELGLEYLLAHMLSTDEADEVRVA